MAKRYSNNNHYQTKADNLANKITKMVTKIGVKMPDESLEPYLENTVQLCTSKQPNKTQKDEITKFLMSKDVSFNGNCLTDGEELFMYFDNKKDKKEIINTILAFFTYDKPIPKVVTKKDKFIEEFGQELFKKTYETLFKHGNENFTVEEALETAQKHIHGHMENLDSYTTNHSKSVNKIEENNKTLKKLKEALFGQTISEENYETLIPKINKMNGLNSSFKELNKNIERSKGEMDKFSARIAECQDIIDSIAEVKRSKYEDLLPLKDEKTTTKKTKI